MAYFQFLPDIEYLSPLEDKSSIDSYVTAKNLFRRIKLSDDALSIKTAYLFDKYIIEEGERPDTVASKIYGNSGLDWLVIFSAGIINQRHEWPLSGQELYDYSLDKYGDDLNAIRFYRTTEVKDSNDRLMLPAGKVVDKGFTIANPSNRSTTINPVSAITNYEYESELNDAKKEIDMLKPAFRIKIVQELADLLKYKEGSTQFVTSFLARTENIRKKSP